MSDVDEWQMLARQLDAYGVASTREVIYIDAGRQYLRLYRAGEIVRQYPVSTAECGLGCAENSGRTPAGLHKIADKIGAGEKPGMIFRSRVSTGECADIRCDASVSGEDCITSRILWLEGLEPGINKGQGVDTHDRYIYIHGTNEEGCIGKAVSHGCIRMKNADVIDLFDRVYVDTPVIIA
jgi:hypothetical protein